MPTQLQDKPKSIYDDENKPEGEGWYEGKKATPDQVKNMEKDFDSASTKPEGLRRGDPENSESSEKGVTDDTLPKKQNKFSAKLKNISRKKRLAFGLSGVIAGIFFTLIGFMSITPFLMGSLNFALNRFDTTSSFAKKTRVDQGFTRMARAYNTGDVGETRVGKIGSVVFHNLNDRLASEHGIAFSRRTTTGRPTYISIARPQNPESPFWGATNEQIRANISRELGIQESLIRGLDDGQTGPAFVSLEGQSTSNLRRIGRGITEIDTITRRKTGGNTLISMRYRNVNKMWNTPSIFRPFAFTGAALQEGFDAWKLNRLNEGKRRNTAGRIANLSSKIEGARVTLKEKIGGVRAGLTSAALTGTGVLCLMYEISELVPSLQYAYVVQPAMEEALDKKAMASQYLAGEEIEEALLSAALQTFNDEEGRSALTSEPMNVLLNNPGVVGAPIDPAVKQSFELRGSNMKDAMQLLIGEAAVDDETIARTLETSDSFASAACSTTGYALQLGVGSVLTFIAPGGAIFKLTQAGGSVAMFALITNRVSGAVEDTVANQSADMCGLVDAGEEEGVWVEDAHKFGGCLAYGSRAMHNTIMTTAGGVELSLEEERLLTQALNEYELSEFQSRSFADRMLDVSNPRSLMSRFANSLLEIRVNKLSSIIVSVFRTPASILNNISSPLTRSVFADETEDYDWGFPLVGIPLSLIEDPKYEDPFDNALKVEQLYRNGTLQSDYSDKIRACFGYEVRDVNGVIKPVFIEEVLMMENEYTEARCNDLSNEDWVRIMLFLYDDSIIASMSCYDGDMQSCRDIGINSRP